MSHPTNVRFGLCGSSFSISTMMIELDIAHGAIDVGTPVSITGGPPTGPVTYSWTGIVTKYKNISGVQYALVQLTNTLNPNLASPPGGGGGSGGGSGDGGGGNGGGGGGGGVVALSFPISITIYISPISFAYTPPDPVDPFDIP